MRIKPTAQMYSEYTADDFAVWELLFNRQMKHLSVHASALYLEALQQIGFHAGEIPDFRKVNIKLQQATGWQLKVAPELVPQADFFSLLSRRIFPATCWLRRMDELDYLEEPDMFHDVFGHAPLLMHPAYAAFMQAFGELAQEWQHHPEALKLLSAVYWFTVEFGLLEEGGIPRVFGAGIISSPGETLHAMSRQPVRRLFDIRQMMHTGYRTDILQEQYFVMSSFGQLREAIPLLEQTLVQLEGKTVPEQL